MPAMSDAYPYVSSYKDRHGHTRWRFRRGKKTIALPGQPGEKRFEDAYLAAVEGRSVQRLAPKMIRGGIIPRSLRDAWRVVRTGKEWKALRETSKDQQRNVAERFFSTQPDPAQPIEWGDVLVENIQRRHIKAILAGRSDTPHAARHVFSLLRKLTAAALDEEWIAVDPTYRLKHRPEFGGWRAWTEGERAAFERRWPLGSTPRLAYALALYTGQRRADVAGMCWTDIEGETIHVVQAKTGRELWLPILPALRQVLALTPRTGETILVTQYGRPFSVKALGMRMQDWTKAAGLPAGATMHGLRKTLGKLLAEGGATTRQLMDVLGHSSMQHAELYSRAAEQRRMAQEAMRAVSGALRPRPEPVEDDGDP